jgi:hypothetical protein
MAAGAILERCALLEALQLETPGRRSLREDWRLHPLILWQRPLEVSLPTAATPRRPVPSFNGGSSEAALDLAEDLSRRAKRADSPTLRDHFRLGQARALAVAGDHVAALAILRRVETEATLQALARAALWEEAAIHQAVGDGLLRRAAFDRWLALGPSEVEWALFEVTEMDVTRAP